jgi:hypothetical protein
MINNLRDTDLLSFGTEEEDASHKESFLELSVLVPRICDRRKSDCYPIKHFFFSCLLLQLRLPPPTCGICCPL